MSWVETHRGMVKAWECDMFGHFTVAYYFDRIADATASFLDRLKRGRALPAATRREPAEVHARFIAELRGGEALHIESGVIAAEAKRLRIGHRLLNSATGKLCSAITVGIAGKFDAAARRRLAAGLIPWEDAGEDPGYGDDMNHGLIASGRDRVKHGELDESSRLALPNYIHRSSIGCIQLLTAMGLTPDYLRQARRGFSTFEVKLRLDTPAPKLDTALSLESGLMHLGGSSMRMVHRLSDASSGKRLATIRQSGVHFDLEARRSTAIPEELRARAAALVMRKPH